MKTVGQIIRKVKQLRYRYLQSLLRLNLKPSPSNCVYNAVVPQVRAAASANGGGVQTQEVRICLYGADSPSSWSASFCDERLDGGARARSCQVFCPHNTKAELKDAFNESFNSIEFPQLAATYPDIAALLWVLDTQDLRANRDQLGEPDDGGEFDDGLEVEPSAEPVVEPSVEPVVEPDSIVDALPESAAGGPDHEEVQLPVALVPKTHWLYRLFGV